MWLSQSNSEMAPMATPFSYATVVPSGRAGSPPSPTEVVDVATFHEGGQPLLGVAGVHVHLHRHRFVVEARGAIGIDGPVDHPLGQGKGAGRARSQPLGQRADGLLELVLAHDAIDEAECEGLIRRERVTEEKDLLDLL